MPTLLVVDDDPAMRALATDILADEGYLVVTAPSGEAGLRLLQPLGWLYGAILCASYPCGR